MTQTERILIENSSMDSSSHLEPNYVKSAEQTALEFSKWKDDNYNLCHDKLYYEHFSTRNGKTIEQLFNEWNNLNNK